VSAEGSPPYRRASLRGAAWISSAILLALLSALLSLLLSLLLPLLPLLLSLLLAVLPLLLSLLLAVLPAVLLAVLTPGPVTTPAFSPAALSSTAPAGLVAAASVSSAHAFLLL
jgi:hypothetical protein